MIELSQGPMLASPSNKIAPDVDAAVEALFVTQAGSWIADQKLDGIRCLAFADRGDVTLINRRGADITFRYPEIVSGLTHAYPTTKVVLDGEIVCLDQHGHPDFTLVHTRDAQQDTRRIPELTASSPATYVAFDLLQQNSTDLRRAPYAGRRHILIDEGRRNFTPQLQVIYSSEYGVTLWDWINKHGLEGMIAKRTTSRYVAGRSRDWVKLKQTYQISVIALGYTEGLGSRASTFGAIKMGLLRNGDVIHIGEVGTGNWTQADLASIKARMDNREILVLEVEVQNLMPSGTVRFPSFKHIRTDLEATDCTADQLDRIPIA